MKFALVFPGQGSQSVGMMTAYPASMYRFYAASADGLTWTPLSTDQAGTTSAATHRLRVEIRDNTITMYDDGVEVHSRSFYLERMFGSHLGETAPHLVSRRSPRT